MHRKEVAPLVTCAAGRLRVLTLLVFLTATTLHAQWSWTPTNLSTWAELDGSVSNTYASLTNWFMFLPPGYHFGLDGSFTTFSPGGDLTALTNLCPCSTQFNVQVWQVNVVETQTTSRVWLYLGTNGVTFRTNPCPSSYSPTQWVQNAYNHSAPSYLTGTNIAKWYADRDRSRFTLSSLFVNSNDWPTLRAAQWTAATNAPPPGNPPPYPPVDSNRLCFAGIQVFTTNNTVLVWVYTPSNRPVAILTRPTLSPHTNAWTVTGGLNATPPFNLWQTTANTNAAFFMAGFTDVDSDHDGIPDVMETYVYGTNPNNPDSDNDGISDFNEIFVFGTDPNNSDTNAPSAVMTSPPNNYQVMWVP